MIQLIALIVFVASLAGILFIIGRKVPVLNTLPQNGTTGIKKHRVILNAEGRIKEISNFFEKQIILHKLLSWIKVITLKIETRVDHSLHNIRKKAQHKK